MMSGPDKLELLRKELSAAVVKRKSLLVVEMLKRIKVLLAGQIQSITLIFLPKLHTIRP
jgi:flagellar biosynthesis protein FliQ